MFESTRKRVRVRAWRGRRDAPTVVAMTSRAPAPAARVLLTGFEPFGGDVHNPSIAAARDAVGILADRGVTAEAVELPCAFGAAGPALTAALDRVRPEVAIAVGLAGGTATVRVERVAVNLQDARIPDNAGEQPVDRPVRADGPAALFATLPAKRAVAAIREAGVAAEPSLSAGAFVCNHVMYALLDAPGTARAAGFLHVPWDAEHRPTPDTPALPAADLARAVAEAALTALAGGPTSTSPAAPCTDLPGPRVRVGAIARARQRRRRRPRTTGRSM
mgnify:CR=1 FL=1